MTVTPLAINADYCREKLGFLDPAAYYRIDKPPFCATILNYPLLHGLRSSIGPKEIVRAVEERIGIAVLHTELQQGILNNPMYIVERLTGGMDGLDGNDPQRFFVVYESYFDIRNARASMVDFADVENLEVA